MQTLFSFFIAFLFVTSTFAQNIIGIWYTETDDETIVFDSQGNFLTHWAAKGISAAGTYSFYGNTLNVFYDNGNEDTYRITQLDSGSHFKMTYPETGETWWYTYQGEASVITETQIENTQAFRLADMSGVYYCTNEDEWITLSPSECFETESPTANTYGIWGIEEGAIKFLFATTGGWASFPVVDFMKGEYFTIKSTNAETGQAFQNTYVYQRPAKTYSQAEVQQVVQQYTNSSNLTYQTQLQMQNSLHRTNMSIINAMGGGSMQYVVKDAYGNIIERY